MALKSKDERRILLHSDLYSEFLKEYEKSQTIESNSTSSSFYQMLSSEDTSQKDESDTSSGADNNPKVAENQALAEDQSKSRNVRTNHNSDSMTFLTANQEKSLLEWYFWAKEKNLYLVEVLQKEGYRASALDYI